LGRQVRPVLVVVRRGHRARRRHPGQGRLEGHDHDEGPLPDDALLEGVLQCGACTGATDRWILTATVLTIGLSYVGVAAGLRLVPPLGRVLLGLGGAFLIVSALFPQPAVVVSWVHMVAGALAWVGFTTWPLTLVSARSVGPRLRRASPAATGSLVVLLAWFTVQMVTSGTWYGLSERITVAAMGVWPIVLAVRGAARELPPRCDRAVPPRTP
jgi:hypothetical protein